MKPPLSALVTIWFFRLPYVSQPDEGDAAAAALIVSV